MGPIGAGPGPTPGRSPVSSLNPQPLEGGTMTATALKREAWVWFARQSGHPPYSARAGEIGRELAAAEAWAKDAEDIGIEWEPDPEYDPFEYDVEGMPAIGWGCHVYRANDDASRVTLASLYGITFDGDGEPWGKDYKRYVEAELALEAMDG